MAILDNDSNNNVNSNVNQNTVADAPGQQKNTWSFDNIGMFGAPIPKTVYNEYYTNIKDGLIEIYKHANAGVEISLLDLDNINSPGLAFSNIIICVRDKKIPDAVAYYILILEATGEKIQPVFENIGGVQTEITRFSCSALDEVLRQIAHEKVIKAFNCKKVLYSEGTVVPSTFSHEDKRKMHMLALNAGLACTTELSIYDNNFADINLTQVPKDNNLFVSVDFIKQQIEDPVGNIMRSDVNTNFGTRRQQQITKSVNTGERESQIAISSGFIDLLWAPMNPQAVFNPYVSQQQQLQTQKYAARLVITNLVTNFGYTPAMVLLALATSVAIRDNNNWINTFRPSALDSGSIDLRDIGALNIESNLENDPSGWGKHIDTKSETFQIQDLGQLISALIRPGLVISIDCPEAGPQSWYLSMFAAAATGHPKATDIIYRAAQQLTGGNFGKYFNVGQPMFDDAYNTVHTGYWIDRKGQKRDLRDIDHLAVCNIAGDRNPELIRGYSDTFLRKDIPAMKRMADRKRIIQALTNESAVFTGITERITFTASFIDALVRGISETGLTVRINSQVLDDINNQRGYADFVNNTLLTGNQSFMTYNVYQGGAQPYMAQQSRRW
jgi:hypothetical protein